MSCGRKVSDEGLCYVVLIKIILLVTHTSLPAVKVEERRRRKHFRNVVYERHVSGSRNRSTYRIENICHCMRNLMFFVYYTGCPTRYRTRHFFNNFTTNEDITTIRRTTDTFLFISHATNVLLFKFHCNIFVGVRIIKEMPGSVASGTTFIIKINSLISYMK